MSLCHWLTLQDDADDVPVNVGFDAEFAGDDDDAFADPDLDPEVPDAVSEDVEEARYEHQLNQRLIGMFVEQMLVVGDQTTRRLLWAHILRLFNQQSLLDTKLAIQPSPGHFHAQMKLGSCMSAHLDSKESKSDAGTFRNLQAALGATWARCQRVTFGGANNRRSWFFGAMVHMDHIAMEHCSDAARAAKFCLNVHDEKTEFFFSSL